MANTLRKAQQQTSIDMYMTVLKICIRHDSEEFSYWLLNEQDITQRKFGLLKLKIIC